MLLSDHIAKLHYAIKNILTNQGRSTLPPHFLNRCYGLDKQSSQTSGSLREFLHLWNLSSLLSSGFQDSVSSRFPFRLTSVVCSYPSAMVSKMRRKGFHGLIKGYAKTFDLFFHVC